MKHPIYWGCYSVLVGILLSPPLSPSGRSLQGESLKHYLEIAEIIQMFEGEGVLERGRSPLSVLHPSPALRACFILFGCGWRGVRGEASKTNQIQKEPKKWERFLVSEYT
jgi:hypothetical protein